MQIEEANNSSIGNKKIKLRLPERLAAGDKPSSARLISIRSIM
ncbi:MULTISPECIES: hypothetical protein [Brucella]|nr:hypothetical protein [[Ochrobactrum] soli]